MNDEWAELTHSVLFDWTEVTETEVKENNTR